MPPWCSGYHYCTASFNWAWTQVLRRFKSSSRRVGIRDGEDLWQWSRLELWLNASRRSTIPQKQFIIIIIGYCQITKAYLGPRGYFRITAKKRQLFSQKAHSYRSSNRSCYIKKGVLSNFILHNTFERRLLLIINIWYGPKYALFILSIFNLSKVQKFTDNVWYKHNKNSQSLFYIYHPISSKH